MDSKLYREVYTDLKKKGTTTISYDRYLDRMKNRNEAIKRKEYQERRIVLK
jgi:hypothetical protein